jgi:hypothetical protein
MTTMKPTFRMVVKTRLMRLRESHSPPPVYRSNTIPVASVVGCLRA